jgi:hypothetical protein
VERNFEELLKSAHGEWAKVVAHASPLSTILDLAGAETIRSSADQDFVVNFFPSRPRATQFLESSRLVISEHNVPLPFHERVARAALGAFPLEIMSSLDAEQRLGYLLRPDRWTLPLEVHSRSLPDSSDAESFYLQAQGAAPKERYELRSRANVLGARHPVPRARRDDSRRGSHADDRARIARRSRPYSSGSESHTL